MSTGFTLDDIRAAADKKYAAVPIKFGKDETVNLLNPLRMSQEGRDVLAGIQDELDAAAQAGTDQVELFQSALIAVAEDKKAARRLIGEIGGDLAVLAMVFETYLGGVQAGEA